MKRSIILVLALLFAAPAFCQYEIKKGTVYSFEPSTDLRSVNRTWSLMSQDCFLWLYDDGMYTIELESNWEYLWTDEFSLFGETEILHVSAGHYYWDGDKLHCKDIITGATFDFISYNLNLITATGLPLMENRVFLNYRKDSHTFPDLSKAMTEAKWQLIDNTVTTQNQLKSTKYLTYLTEFLVFTIDIRPDSTYDMEYGGLLLSQGKWERNGNLLVMHDNNIGGNYYALIGDDKLSINILGDGQKTLSLADVVDFITCPEPEIGYVGNPWTEIDPEYEDVFMVVEEEPEFPGGTAALLEYFRNSIEYPQDALRDNIEGRVIVNFIVEEDGSITHPKVLKSISPSVDAEALRIINLMPKWKPGKQNGKTCRVSYSVPVTFRIRP